MKLPVCLSIVPGAVRSLSVALLLAPLLASAFPPSPPHVIYGTVRNEWGDALTLGGGQIILETTNGLQLTASIANDVEPGVNYRLTVPLDAGISADLYKPTALRPLVGFKLKVRVGQTIYLPIQMTGSFVNLGKPAQSTRLDLTLGEDSDGDGLPDAWERLVIAMLGGGLSLADINPNGIAPNGMTFYANYIAGTFPWDPEDGLRLALVGGTTAAPLLEFLALSGRTYTLQTSTNLQTWSAAQFRIPAQGPTGSPMSSYRATGAALLRIEPALPAGVPVANYFFRARVQ